METVVLVNAAPGYEERVASALQDEDGVAGIAGVQQENFNMAILLQVDGPNKLQKFLTNTLMFVSGVQGAELDKDPSDDLMERLESEGPGRPERQGGRGRGGRGRPGQGPGEPTPGEPGPGGSGPSEPGTGGPPGSDPDDDEGPSIPGAHERDRPPTDPGGRTPGGRTPGGRGPGGRTPGGSDPTDVGPPSDDDEEDIPGVDEAGIPGPGDEGGVGGPRDPDPRELRGEKDEDEED